MRTTRILEAKSQVKVTGQESSNLIDEIMNLERSITDSISNKALKSIQAKIQNAYDRLDAVNGQLVADIEAVNAI